MAAERRRLTFPRNPSEMRQALKPPSHRVAEELAESSRTDAKSVVRKLGSTPAGLGPRQASQVRETVGPNVVASGEQTTWVRASLRAFASPFVLLLMVICVVMVVTADLLSAGTIGVMVVVAVALSATQEMKAVRSTEALQNLVITTTTVRRPNTGERPRSHHRERVPTADLVPGDVVELKAGDIIPADLRVIEAKDLTVSQATLTGESLPQDKTPDVVDTDAVGVLTARNLCFMGTSVVAGTGAAVIVATGARTYFGTMAEIVETVSGESNYDRSIRKVSLLLARMMLVMVPLVFLFNLWHTGDVLGAALFATAIAVGLTPSMLPTVISANLARGGAFMAAQQVIVKTPEAIQNLGAMDVLCTDKTGTLTEDRIVLERHLDITGRDSDFVLLNGYLNSTHQTGVRNTLDHAVLDAFEEHADAIRHTFRVVDEIPFDFERRRVSVVLDKLPRIEHLELDLPEAEAFYGERGLGPEDDVLITKGAYLEVLDCCDQVYHDGVIVPLDDRLRQQVQATVDAEAGRGMRVLAVALKRIPADIARKRYVDARWAYSSADEAQMVLVGLLTFLDPPKESAAPAIASLRHNGVEVKVISGDSHLVTDHVVERLGIRDEKKEALTLIGADVEALDDVQLEQRVADVQVFAEMSPLQKRRVIEALQKRGHVVGYLGDGINDAPSLRQADVGVSVIEGVDIAKETADIVLLQHDLGVLGIGILQGRRTFGNIQKYLKITVASNFGNAFSVLIASIFIPFIPMLAIQILVQNLLYDICQITLPWDRVDRSFLSRPRKWQESHLTRFMVIFGPLSSVFDIIAFMVLWFVFGATGVTAAGVRDPASEHLFQTGWFLVGIITQVLVIHMLRTERVPFLQSRAAAPLTVASVLTVLVAITLPLIPLTAGAFSFVAPPLGYYPWLIGIVVAFGVVTQLVKTWYIRRYQQWL